MSRSEKGVPAQQCVIGMLELKGWLCFLDQSEPQHLLDLMQEGHCFGHVQMREYIAPRQMDHERTQRKKTLAEEGKVGDRVQMMEVERGKQGASFSDRELGLVSQVQAPYSTLQQRKKKGQRVEV